jgi:hypothetical protein
MDEQFFRQFPPGSPERVVAHARWQRSRGRRPAMRLNETKNPNRALQQAQALLRFYKGDPGSHIHDVAARLTINAQALGETLALDFNGSDLLAHPGDSPETAVARWSAEEDRLSQEYHATPKYKAQRANTEARRVRLQAAADQHMASLPQLDLTSVGDILTWLEQLLGYANDGHSDMPWTQVVTALQEGGYEAGANCGDAFDGEDGDNYARWLIGNYMDIVADGGVAMNTLYHSFGLWVQPWRDKFISV